MPGWGGEEADAGIWQCQDGEARRLTQAYGSTRMGRRGGCRRDMAVPGWGGEEADAGIWQCQDGEARRLTQAYGSARMGRRGG